MRAINSLTAAYVRSILDYDQATGEFRWKERPREHFKTERSCRMWNTRFSGKIAGSINSNGYWVIGVNDKVHGAHRLAWLYMSGAWPKADIDHIDLDRSNNRFANLRSATRSQNTHNTRPPTTNKSGVKGVSFHGQSRKWRAKITANGRECCLGYFDDISVAAAAYSRAAQELHGEFARFK